MLRSAAAKYRINMAKLRGWSDNFDAALTVAPSSAQIVQVSNANRRRIGIFTTVFLAGCALRLIYAVLRPPLRQGIRFADIGRIVGRLSHDELAAYMRDAPPTGAVGTD